MPSSNFILQFFSSENDKYPSIDRRQKRGAMLSFFFPANMGNAF
jgi:hypothetical protein